MDEPCENDAPLPARGHRLGVLTGVVSVAMLCCAAAALLFLTGSGADTAGSAPTTLDASPAPGPQERQTMFSEDVIEPEAHVGIDLSARQVQFMPAQETELESTYTSVWVRLENNSDHPLSVAAAAFFLTDTDNRDHDPALGADIREIADGESVSLHPGDEMVGVVTAEGTFDPGTLSYYPDNSGAPVVVNVEPA